MELYIVSETEKHSMKNSGPYGDKVLTPDEAIGEIVEIEFPGTMGKEPYEIVEVREDKTLVENVMSGSRQVITESVLPPAPDSMTCPPIGKEYEAWRKEHLNGRGEWVETVRGSTPKLVQTYHGVYEGHEKTRIMKETFKYLPEGIISINIYVGEGKVKDYGNEEYRGWGEVKDEVNPEGINSYQHKVGEMYIDVESNEVVKYEIDRIFRSENYVGFYDNLENPII